MIPKKLILEGFLSYKNRIEIDFDKLTQDNVFGIFGPIGSGKSTILDAICFALFDENYRKLNQEELVSLGRNDFLVEFHFAIQKDIYCVVKKYRNKNKTAALYKNNNLINDKIIEIKNEITHLLNLNYEKFIKTVIIPQGTYHHLLNESNYFALLKEYLNIPEITIHEKITTFKKNLNNNIQEKEAILDQYHDVNEENITKFETEIQTISSEIQYFESELEKVQSDLASKETIFNHFHEFRLLKEKYEQHTANEESFQVLKKETLWKEFLYINFKDLFTEKKRLFEDIKNKEQKFQENSIHLNDLTTQLESKLQEQEILERKNENISKLEIHLKDLEVVKNILFIQKNIDNLIKENEKINFEKEENEKRLKSLCLDIQRNMEKKSDLEKQLSAYNHQLINQVKIQNDNIKKIYQELEGLYQKIQNVYPNFLNVTYQHFQKYLDKIELKKQSIEIDLKLLNLSIELQEGLPCKLCGSTQHPNPLKTHNQNELIKELERLTSLYQSLRENSFEYYNLMIKGEWEIHNLDSQISLLNLEDFENIEETLENILKKIDENLQIIKNLENESKDLEGKKIKLETTIQNYSHNFQSNLEKIQDYEKEKVNITQSLNNPDLDITKYSDESLKEKINSIKNEIDDYKNLKKEVEKQVNELNLKHSKIETEQNYLKQELEKQTKQFENIENEIKSRILNVNNVQEEVINEILRTYDYSEVEKIKKQIAEYETLKIEYQKELNIAQEKVKNKEPISEIEIENLKNNIKLFTELLNEKKQSKIEKEILLKNLKEKWYKRQLVQNELKVLTRKKVIVDDFYKFGKKDDFENFIVELYLEEFRKEVNQNLRLLNQGDFELVKEFKDKKTVLLVEDHRNGGLKRSLNSLSGGQSFLTSFAIGLTISNQINKNKSKGFFFIDEGFGSLDTESLQQIKQLIFKLRNENRIIGIITHVNELQECITQKIVLERKNEGTIVKYFS